MKKSFLLSVLILGVILIKGLVTFELILADPFTAEHQNSSLQVILSTDTLAAYVEPTPIVSRVESDEAISVAPDTITAESPHPDTVIELRGSTQIVISKEKTEPPQQVPTKQIPTQQQPAPMGDYPDELLGEYYCYGFEGGLFASWGRVILEKNGTIETIRYYGQTDFGEWRYDEEGGRIIFSPGTFFLDSGSVNWSDKNIELFFHPWAANFMAHAETGWMRCNPN